MSHKRTKRLQSTGSTIWNLFTSVSQVSYPILISFTRTSKGVYERFFHLNKFIWIFLKTVRRFVKVLVLFSRFRTFIFYIDTGSPNVVDASGQGISRGVYSEIVFANFKAHKFSYLNVTSLSTEYVLNSSECWFACVEALSCFSLNMAAPGV